MSEALVSKFPVQTTHRNDVAAAVRAHMGVRKVKDAALARDVGMSQSAMSRRTNGELPFDVDELGRIAERFGIELADLITMPKGPTTDYGYDGSSPVIQLSDHRHALREARLSAGGAVVSPFPVKAGA